VGAKSSGFTNEKNTSKREEPREIKVIEILRIF
jgi:hypothetical protein